MELPSNLKTIGMIGVYLLGLGAMAVIYVYIAIHFRNQIVGMAQTVLNGQA